MLYSNKHSDFSKSLIFVSKARNFVGRGGQKFGQESKFLVLLSISISNPFLTYIYFRKRISGSI